MSFISTNLIFILLLIVFTCSGAHCQDGTTHFIDHVSKVESYAESDWFLANIPFIELPVSEIEDVYYYRWSSFKRHLRYTMIGGGYSITEFIHKVFYSQKWDTINAAAGHHIHEGKWLRNQRYVQDYINLWSREGAAAQQYSEWIADAAYSSYLINADVEFIKSQQAGLVHNYNTWVDSNYDSALNLFYITPHDDAQEQSCSSIQTDDPYRGGLGYRPSFNSEMYGNALAIARIAALNGDVETELDFTNRANLLRNSILTHLWDETRGFFYHRQRLNNPDNTLLDSREQVGFFPWRWNVPYSSNETLFTRAWYYLYQSDAFNSSYGPTTCEQTSVWYDGDQTSQCCWWNGNSWPYSTSLTLGALAAQVRNYGSTLYANVNTYVNQLTTYAKTQYKNGVPYVAECHSPGRKIWVCDSFNHSEHYAHSTYTDNVLSELIGVIPKEDDVFELYPLIPTDWSYFALEHLLYHGHNISVIFDLDGSHYPATGGIIGLQIYVNGELVATRPDLGPMAVEIPSPILTSVKNLENYASNPELRGYPRPNASFTDPYSSTWHAIDGRIVYDYVPVNRWSNFESPNEVDWFEVDLGPGRTKWFDQVKLYIYSDVVTGQGRTDCPKQMVVEVFNSSTTTWTPIASISDCIPNSVNTIHFSSTYTSRLRVVFTRDYELDYYIGITELELWAEFPQTALDEEYEFEDGFLNEAQVMSSGSASSGSYVGEMSSAGSSVEITGIWIETPGGGQYDIDIYYANAGLNNSTLRLTVNNLFVMNSIVFPPTTTNGFDNFVTISLQLMRGNNNLIFRKGENLVDLDRIVLNRAKNI